MTAWVLIVWLVVPRLGPMGITSTDFGSHDACVQAARGLEANLGASMGFLCIEKNPAPRKVKKK